MRGDFFALCELCVAPHPILIMLLLININIGTKTKHVVSKL